MTRPTLFARVRDVRVWVWALAIATAWWLDREWRPDHVVSRTADGAMVIKASAAALIWPGALTLAAAVGTVRAWSGRSVVNGAYLAGCLLVLIVFGSVSGVRLSYRLEVDATQARVRTHGVYWRTMERAQLAQVGEVPVVRRGVNVVWPVLIGKDGRRVHVRGAGAWEFAETLVRLWQIPLERATIKGSLTEAMTARENDLKVDAGNFTAIDRGMGIYPGTAR
jgi:hypothetical protein